MFQAADGLRGTEHATEDLIKKVQSKGRTIDYALEGSDDLRFLDSMKANASAGGPQNLNILLRTAPRKIEVLEEFLHGTQQRLGLINKLGIRGAEVHVKDFMIRHQKRLGISNEDVEILRRMMTGDQ